MIVRILGKAWRLVFVRGLIAQKRARGECDPPEKRGKQIRVDESLHGEERLEVIIHEMLHAGLWLLDEDVVARLAVCIARELTRLGYICKDEHNECR